MDVYFIKTKPNSREVVFGREYEDKVESKLRALIPITRTERLVALYNVAFTQLPSHF
jgi:hypothetical protein